MISPLDLPMEVFSKPQVWTRYLLVSTPKGLIGKGYTTPKLQTFSDQVSDSMADSHRGYQTHVTYVWYKGQWNRVV
jgi:hypothetical protein